MDLESKPRKLASTRSDKPTQVRPPLVPSPPSSEENTKNVQRVVEINLLRKLYM